MKRPCGLQRESIGTRKWSCESWASPCPSVGLDFPVYKIVCPVPMASKEAQGKLE